MYNLSEQTGWINGRKTNAAVAFCDEGEIPPVHFKEIIFFNILKQEIINKKSFFVATLHRLQSMQKNKTCVCDLGQTQIAKPQ